MALKTLIIDDNPNTVRSLERTIDWAALGCEVAGVALDGREGAARIRACKPDIILTDIRMPELDGLDMIEQAREHVPDARVIIITGHDEFQYASRAIKLSVFDYILKPIDNAEVERTVRRAAASLRSERERSDHLSEAGNARRQALLLSLLVNESHTGQGARDMLAQAGVAFGACYVMAVQPAAGRVLPQPLVHRLDDAVAGARVRAVTLVAYDMLIVLVMREDAQGFREEAGALAEALLAQGMPLRIGVSEITDAYEGLREAYRQARKALWGVALKKSQRGLNFYSAQGVAPGAWLAGMQRAVEELAAREPLDEDTAARVAAQIAALAGARAADLRALLALYGQLVRQRVPTPLTPELHEAIFEMWYVLDEGDVRRSLCAFYAAIRQVGEREHEQAERYSLLTRNALSYIRLHAIEGLRLEDVAERLCVSANYLSALVRKETGVTYQQHVLGAKMDMAKRMLADPRMHVEEIARAVGYENYVSFYNAFKRRERMTPTEYRNRRATP